jgi:hypothetical protein
MQGFTLLITLLCTGLSVRAQSGLNRARLHKADRAKWDEILTIPSDCEGRFSRTSGDVDDAGLDFDRINRNESLVIVECYPGAYEPGVILYLLTERPARNARMLRLDGLESGTDVDGSPLAYQIFGGLVHFYQKTNTLEASPQPQRWGSQSTQLPP